MIALLALVLVVAVTGFVVQPLLAASTAAETPLVPTGRELWTREKAVAVLAITEADFDRATGKLSDDDYRVLRSDYEGRALHAMGEIDRLAPVTAVSSTAPPRFCASCGARFRDADAFCGSCGGRRHPG